MDYGVSAIIRSNALLLKRYLCLPYSLAPLCLKLLTAGHEGHNAGVQRHH